MDILISSFVACASTNRMKLRGQLCKSMAKVAHFVRAVSFAICVTVSFSSCCSLASAQAQVTPAQQHDGQHDFDFHFGNWGIHIKLLLNTPTGSQNWVESDGKVSVRKIWDGLGNLEELDDATTHFKGTTLFLYDPKNHQWSQASANMDDGTLGPPLIGEFKNGRGEFYGQQTYNGRTVLVRFVWSDITANSHRVEQSYSADGGKTWEPTLIANLTRE
jgi:hypothetical protein